MEIRTCRKCEAVLGETAGNLLVIDARGERIEIVGAESVERRCRRCGTVTVIYAARITVPL